MGFNINAVKWEISFLISSELWQIKRKIKSYMRPSFLIYYICHLNESKIDENRDFHHQYFTVSAEWRRCVLLDEVCWSVSHPGCGFPLASQWMTMFSRGSTMYSFGDWWVIVGGCGTAGHMTRVSLDSQSENTHTAGSVDMQNKMKRT